MIHNNTLMLLFGQVIRVVCRENLEMSPLGNIEISPFVCSETTLLKG